MPEAPKMHSAESLLALARGHELTGQRHAAESHRRSAKDLVDPPKTRHRWQHGELQQAGNWTTSPTTIYCSICYQATNLEPGISQEEIRNHPGPSPCATIHLRKPAPVPEHEKKSKSWDCNYNGQGDIPEDISCCGLHGSWARWTRQKHRYLAGHERMTGYGYPILRVNCPDCLATPEQERQPDPTQYEKEEGIMRQLKAAWQVIKPRNQTEVGVITFGLLSMPSLGLLYFAYAGGQTLLSRGAGIFALAVAAGFAASSIKWFWMNRTPAKPPSSDAARLKIIAETEPTEEPTTPDSEDQVLRNETTETAQAS